MKEIAEWLLVPGGRMELSAFLEMRLIISLGMMYEELAITNVSVIRFHLRI